MILTIYNSTSDIVVFWQKCSWENSSTELTKLINKNENKKCGNYHRHKILSKTVTLLYIITSSSDFPGFFAFPRVTQFFTFDFFFQYNLVCFDFVQASSSKKLCLILFDSLYSEKFDGNFVLCNTLYTGGKGDGYKLYMTVIPCCPRGWLLYKLWEHQILGPRPSYFPLPLQVLTLFM